MQGRLALFPASARIVAGIDARQLRASPAAAKVQTLAVESRFDDQSVRRPCLAATKSSPLFCSSSRA